MKKEYLECGKIVNTHGFRGTVKSESYCDSPAVLAKLPEVFFCDGENYFPKKVLHASVFRQFVLMDLEGVTDETAANRLRNKIIYASRKDLPLREGSYFLSDLLGLPVRLAESGEEVGILSDVDPRPTGDLYTVKTPHGEELLPAVPEFVVKIDPDDAIYVRPIPGLLDGEAENV